MPKTKQLSKKSRVMVACVFSGSFVVFVIILLISHVLIIDNSFENINLEITFAACIVSLFVSVVALAIAFTTYYSIDAVSKISSMEGNVLSNECYNAEYYNLVEKYKKCQNQNSLENALYENLYYDLRDNSETCMQFTDRIQSILDHILWFGYVDTTTDKYERDVETIIKLLEKRYKKFNAISNGNQYILNEHIKLIKCVLGYQRRIRNGEGLSLENQLLNVRGRMLNNAVSKTVYFDYLGLEYHKRAINLLRTKLQFENEEFLKKNMQTIRNYFSMEKITDEKREVREELELYLRKALDAFEKAEESSAEDVLWKGYITFNKARVDLLQCIINNRFKEGWDVSIKDAISARYAVLKTFFPNEGTSDAESSSFLQQEFRKEYYYAKSLLLLMQSYCEGRKIIEIKKEAEIILLKLPEERDKDIFTRTRTYLKEIEENITCQVEESA